MIRWPNQKGVSQPVAQAVFGLLFENSSEVVLVVHRVHRRVVCANLPAAELLAMSADELEGRLFDDLVCEARDLGAAGHYEEIGLQRSDGYPVYVELDIIHVDHPEHGPLAALIARDTTERRNLQLEILAKHSALIAAHAELEARNSQIASLAWRAAMGELVAGVAHHLNNPVAALASTVTRLRTKVVNLPATERLEIDKLVERVIRIAARIEFNVGEIMRVTQNVGRAKSDEFPPELAEAVSSFVRGLDTIPTKESP